VFDLRTAKIIEKLDLLQTIYVQTSVGGHFGKDYFMWEKLYKVVQLKKTILEN